MHDRHAGREEVCFQVTLVLQGATTQMPSRAHTCLLFYISTLTGPGWARATCPFHQEHAGPGRKADCNFPDKKEPRKLRKYYFLLALTLHD